MSQINVELPLLAEDDARSRLASWIREKYASTEHGFRHDNGFRFPIRAFVMDLLQEERQKIIQRMEEAPRHTVFDESKNCDVLLGAAWDLVRHGILTPAQLRPLSGGIQFDGTAFFLTQYGERWVQALADSALPTEYGRFASFLSQHGQKLRPSFTSRSLEALRCYQTGTYLAACSMCGAAVESILLSVAVAATGDEAEILREYGRADGVRRVRNRVLANQSGALHQAFDSALELIKYWRDESAHASEVAIGEEEAFWGLVLLHRLAQTADRRWTELTVPRT